MSAVASLKAGDVRRTMLWAGRAISGLPVLMLVLSACMKLSRSAHVVDLFAQKYGYREGALLPLGAMRLTAG